MRRRAVLRLALAAVALGLAGEAIAGWLAFERLCAAKSGAHGEHGRPITWDGGIAARSLRALGIGPAPRVCSVPELRGDAQRHALGSPG